MEFCVNFISLFLLQENALTLSFIDYWVSALSNLVVVTESVLLFSQISNSCRSFRDLQQMELVCFLLFAFSFPLLSLSFFLYRLLGSSSALHTALSRSIQCPTLFDINIFLMWHGFHFLHSLPMPWNLPSLPPPPSHFILLFWITHVYSKYLLSSDMPGTEGKDRVINLSPRAAPVWLFQMSSNRCC